VNFTLFVITWGLLFLSNNPCLDPVVASFRHLHGWISVRRRREGRKRVMMLADQEYAACAELTFSDNCHAVSASAPNPGAPGGLWILHLLFSRRYRSKSILT